MMMFIAKGYKFKQDVGKELIVGLTGDLIKFSLGAAASTLLG